MSRVAWTLACLYSNAGLESVADVQEGAFCSVSVLRGDGTCHCLPSHRSVRSVVMVRGGGVSETSFWRRGDEVQIFRPTSQIEFHANLKNWCRFGSFENMWLLLR